MLKPWKQKWTPDQEKLLADMYAKGCKDGEISAALGNCFTPKSVYAKRARMRLVNVERGEQQKKSRAIMSADLEMSEDAIVRVHQRHLEDLRAAYPNGAPYMREKPTLGGAKRFTPDPELMYRSSAAACAEA
jgi:hypothetical protein